jgi:NodT family efflux transporter outer membrane factor (OMF) lipoprotein
VRPPLALLLLLLAGCNPVGTNYVRPDIETPRLTVDVAEVDTGEGIVRITTEAPVDRWWTIFHDPQLDRLITEARFGNNDLRAAVARVHAARAVVREAFAPLFPTIGATLGYTYLKFAPNALPMSPQTGQVAFPGVSPGPGGTPVGSQSPTTFAFSGTPFQLWSGLADMNYELDLWGKIRRSLEGAEAQEAATEEDRKNVEITLVSEVADAYFDLGEAEADLEISEEGVRLREQTLELVEERLKGGLVPELDVRRARGELARARAQVPDAERRKAVAEHRLAVLLGRMPNLRFEGRAPAAFELPPELPVGIPATLLERRPDVRAAEHRLRASNASIGEALANFFPSVTIFGRFGYVSIDIWKIAEPNSQLYAAGPSIRIPIFEGGRTYARLLETEANTDTATATYYQTILIAFREVADAIAGIVAQSRVQKEQTVNVSESQQAVVLVTEQYEKGITTYLNVLDAQRTLLEARQDLVRAQRLVLSNVVQLEKALGGGWTEALPEEDGRARSGE